MDTRPPCSMHRLVAVWKVPVCSQRLRRWEGSPLGDLAPTHQGADGRASSACHRSSSSLSSSRTHSTPHCHQTYCPQRLPKTERCAPSPVPSWLWRSRTRRTGPPTIGRWRNSGGVTFGFCAGGQVTGAAGRRARRAGRGPPGVARKTMGSCCCPVRGVFSTGPSPWSPHAPSDICLSFNL